MEELSADEVSYRRENVRFNRYPCFSVNTGNGTLSLQLYFVLMLGGSGAG